MKSSKPTKNPPVRKPAKAKAIKGVAAVEPTPAARDYRVYSEEEKALALETVNLEGGNIASAARKLGIPENTIRNWSKGDGISDQTLADFANRKRGRLSNKLTLLQDLIADELMSELKLTLANHKD